MALDPARDGVGISRKRVAQDNPDKVVRNFAVIGVDTKVQRARERIATVVGEETGDPHRIDGDHDFNITAGLC